MYLFFSLIGLSVWKLSPIVSFFLWGLNLQPTCEQRYWKPLPWFFYTQYRAKKMPSAVFVCFYKILFKKSLVFQQLEHIFSYYRSLTLMGICLSTAQPGSHSLLLPYCFPKSLPYCFPKLLPFTGLANPNQGQFSLLSPLPSSTTNLSELLCLPPLTSSLHLGQTLTSWPTKTTAEWCLNRATAPSQMDDSEAQEKKM